MILSQDRRKEQYFKNRNLRFIHKKEVRRWQKLIIRTDLRLRRHFRRRFGPVDYRYCRRYFRRKSSRIHGLAAEFEQKPRTFEYPRQILNYFSKQPEKCCE